MTHHTTTFQHRYQNLLHTLAPYQQHPDQLIHHLIDLGTSHPPLPKKHKTPQNLIPGCLSKVWIHAKIKNQQLHLQGDSDAHLTRGLLAIAIELYTELTPKEILAAPPINPQNLGLHHHLTTQRQGGFITILHTIYLHAQQHT